MSRAIASSWLVFLAVGLVPASARAQAAVLVHDTSIYADSADAPLKSPEGVACTESGHVVVADTGNKRLVLYTFLDGRLRGGSEVKLPQLVAPQRVQIAANGDVLVLDLKTRKIVRVAQDGSYGGTIEPSGLKGAPLGLTTSFKLDGAGNVYVLDGKERRVLVLEPSGAVKAELPLPKESGIFSDIAVDLAGTVYAVDAVKAVVWSVEKGGTTFKALTPSLKDRMSFPAYIAVSKGKLFVVDQNGNGVVVLGIDGSYQGRQLSIGWSDGLVNYPSQICLTEGYLLLADRFNQRVQAFAIPK